jgi:hypothetical protein
MRVQKYALLFGTVLMGLAALPLHAQAPLLARNITFNGRSLTPDQTKKLQLVEAYFGQRLPDGKYWYDNRSGAMGMWGGPAAALLPAGLGFGGPMPADASGGGTRMFVNGRELHPIDVAMLGGRVVPGRYWLDAYGNYGIEGGPILGNLLAQAQGPSQGRQPHRVYADGEIAGSGPTGTIVNAAGAMTNTGSVYSGR